MKDISPTNQSPELAEIRLADNSERKHVIFEIVRASLCYDGEVKLGGTVGLAKIGKAASQGQNDRFDAADTENKEGGSRLPRAGDRGLGSCNTT